MLTKFLNLYVVSLTVAGIMGCSQLPQSFAGQEKAAPPKEVLAQVRKVQEALPAAEGTIVSLRGKVGNRVPLLGSTAYELRDGSGVIWVLTKESTPNLGEEIVVTGKVRSQSIPIQTGQPDSTSTYLEQQSGFYQVPSGK